MLGTVGVAPALREVRTTWCRLLRRQHGHPELHAGTTVYLGVNVEGALFSVGDGHYRQGEGETCGTALEGAMNSTIHRRPDQRPRPGMAALRARRRADHRRISAPLEGRLAMQSSRDDPLAVRAVRPEHHGRLSDCAANCACRHWPTSWMSTTARSPRSTPRCYPRPDPTTGCTDV